MHDEPTGDIHAPTMLVAELTHRCALRCPYCSNPLILARQEDELDVATWSRVFVEARALGVRGVRLSGGEPGLRRDLVEIAASAREAGLHTTLVTSGVGIGTRTMRDLWEAGLHAVHVSFQDSDAVEGDRLAGHASAFQRKHALATEAVRLGIGLTVQFVLHRINIARVPRMVDLAVSLRASRVELMPMQLTGWAAGNAGALMPDRATAAQAVEQIGAMASRYRGRIEIASPALCGGGSAAGNDRRDCDAMIVRPGGDVLPSEHDRHSPGCDLWSVKSHGLAEIWHASPAFRRDDPVQSSHSAGWPGDAATPLAELPLVYRR